MRPYNAGREAKGLREAAYGSEFVTLRPTQEVQALPAPNGAELHNDDGTITHVKPGDWLIEGPGGTLLGVPADVIAEHYEVAGGDSEAWQSTRDSFDGKDSGEQPQGPIAFADELAVATDAGAIEGGVEGAAPGSAADEEAKELSVADRRALREEFRALAIEAENRLRRMAAEAVAQKLISTHDAAAWVQTGVIPDGVYIVDTPEGTKVSSAPDKVVEEVPGDEVITTEGHPHSEKDDFGDPQKLEVSEHEVPDPFEGQSYRELQAVAKANDIPAGGGQKELHERLVAARNAGALPNVPK